MTTQPVPAVPSLSEAFAGWRKHVEAELKGVPFDKKLVTRTAEGIAVQPLYTRNGEKPAEDIRRGWRRPVAGARSWQIAQRIQAPDAATFGRWLRADLMAGQDSVVLALDGTAGVDCTLSDVTAALAEVDLTAVPLHVAAGLDAQPVAEVLQAWAEATDVDFTQVEGSVTVDPIGTWLTRGELPGGWAAAWDKQAAWVRDAAPTMPKMRTVAVDGRAWHEAGGSAVQELAFVLATAVETLRELGARGVPVAVAARQLQVTFAVGPQFFMELAKFRAWRLLWSKALTAAGAGEAASASFVVAESGARNKSRLDIHANLLRITTEGLAAVLGGVDALHLAPHDAVEAGTDERARRLARNVHLLLGEEFHLADTADPAGGSWYSEALTDELARAAWTLFQEVEAGGGMAKALEAGWPQTRIAAVAAFEAKALSQRRHGLVGTNIFPNPRDRLAARKPAAPTGSGAGRLVPRRWAEPFEELRETAQAAATRPGIYLAKIGSLKQHKARADFAAGFLAVGGFAMESPPACQTAEKAAEAALAAGARTVVLCSSDDLYPTLVPVFAGIIKAADPTITLVLAGLPADVTVVDAYRAAGIDEFIHLKADVLEINGRLLAQGGVLS